MKCLKCGAEYEDGYSTCADCRIPLVPDDYKPDEIKKTPDNDMSVRPVNVSLIAPFAAHLEDIGFQINEEEGSLKARYSQLPSIFLTEYENGIIFEMWFKPTDYAKNNIAEYCQFANKCNNDVPIVRSAARMEEEAFVIDTWIPGFFQKELFDSFIKLFIAEITGVLMRNDDFQKFLEKYPDR